MGCCGCSAPASLAPTPIAPEPTPLTPVTPAAIEGQQLLGTTPPATASTDPLRGLVTTGDANERAQLGASIGRIAGTSVGNMLLNSVRDRNVVLDIVDDAQFDARSHGAKDAVGLFVGSPTAPPTVLVRSSALTADKADDLRHILAHELTHAAQFVGGEQQQSYATGIGNAAAGLSDAQLKVGTTLMQESGAEVVASSIDAQLQDPTGFAAHARDKIDAAAAFNWKTVNEAGYNPQAYPLPQFVSPIALQLVKQGLG
jgi:hypothetical protein